MEVVSNKNNYSYIYNGIVYYNATVFYKNKKIIKAGNILCFRDYIKSQIYDIHNKSGILSRRKNKDNKYTIEEIYNPDCNYDGYWIDINKVKEDHRNIWIDAINNYNPQPSCPHNELIAKNEEITRLQYELKCANDKINKLEIENGTVNEKYIQLEKKYMSLDTLCRRYKSFKSKYFNLKNKLMST
jgi:hypothetical protein